DSDILKLVKKYTGQYVIPIYFEDLHGPLQGLDIEGNVMDVQEEIPLIEYPQTEEDILIDNYCPEDEEESYHDACSQDVGGEVDPTEDANDVGSHEVDPTKDANDAGSHEVDPTEDTNYAASDDGASQRGDAASHDGAVQRDDGGSHDGAGQRDEAQHGEDRSQTVGQEDEQVDESAEQQNEGAEQDSKGTDHHFGDSEDSQDSEYEPEESSGDSSELSEWELEDLEGPDDDDIFQQRGHDHAKKIHKRAREWVKLRRKQKKKAREEAAGLKRSRGRDWYSEAEDDDNCFEEPDEWNDSSDMSRFDLKVGQKFPCRAKFKDVIRDWSVRKGYDLKFPKNEAKLITAQCKSGCDWPLRASVIGGLSTFQIKTLKRKHTCSYRTENTQADYIYLGKRMLDTLKDNPGETL
ncbi:Unknown protein, partial [Striga hermonthica]